MVLIKWKHHGDPVPQGKILPREVKSFTSFIRPGSAHARPNFLAGLVFARGLAVVEDVTWSVWHTRGMTNTALSVGDRQEVSTQGEEDQPG